MCARRTLSILRTLAQLAAAGEVENVPALVYHFPADLSDDKQLTNPIREQSKDESSVHVSCKFHSLNVEGS